MKKRRIHQNWNFWKEGDEAQKQVVQLPYDAMIFEKRIPEMENGSGAAFYPGGTYFYEKIFFGKEEYKEQSVILEFEGVYMNSTVFLNGEKVGGWIYGYTNFFVDLTGKIKIGEENCLLVKADNSKTPNARWYTGSGIYRPVNMWSGGCVHIKPQGLLVKTLSINPAVIELTVDYGTGAEPLCEASRGNVAVEYEIVDEGQKIATASGPHTQVIISDAKLWSDETPHLYTVKAVLKMNGTVVDEAEEAFGIRTLEWDSKAGFQVNGKTVKLKGGCIHHDHGVLGACTYDKAEYRRIKKLKEFGFNAIRYSHYPAGKNLLDVCDRLGMYVMDESFDQWRRSKSKYDYSNYFDEECEKDIAALVWKDYNHPSVIMYSIGNEIVDTGRLYGIEIAHNLTKVIKTIDNTRPVTIANNAPMSMVANAMEELENERGAQIGSLEINELITAHPELANSLQKGEYGSEKLEMIVGDMFNELDIAGHNYAHEFYDGIHKLRPDRIILSAETFPCRMAENWKWVAENDYCIGDFLWTAWDYLGEAGVGLPVYGTKEAPFAKSYPCLTGACGSFDLIGQPEAAAYYEAVIWGKYTKPYIGVRPVNHSGEDYTIGMWRLTDAYSSWTWDNCEGKTAEIIVYSIGKWISLYQDGVLIDTKELVDCKAEFQVTYNPGRLEAVSMDKNNNEISRSVLETAKNSVQLVISPEEIQVRADAEEIVYIPICVTDQNGVLRMQTDKKITVTVEGEGTLLALGSGRPETEEGFYDNCCTTWHGMVLAVIRCSGNVGMIQVTATTKGCEAVTACIQTLK